MESGFLTIILVSTFEVYSSHSGVRDWEDVMVAREGMPTTLVCTDTIVRGAVAINWMVKSLDEWKLVLSASESKKFSGGASKASTRLTDPNFQDTGVFSLFLVPRMEDSGLYSCLIKQQERKLKEKIILLAILTVTVLPAAPIPQLSTVRLAARVNPGYAVKITWAAPGGIYMKSKKTNTDTVTKLPLVQNKDGGTYVCMVHPWGNSSNTVFAFDVDVTVDAYSVASFTNITYETEISTATRAQTLFPLTCPGVQGDYVRLHWLPPDSKKHSEVELVYQNDSWGGLTFVTKHNKRLQLAGPPYNAEAGSFSFLLTPELKDGGLYICEVFLNDIAVSRRTTLSVLTVEGVSVTTPSLLPSLSALLLLVPLVAAAVCVLLWRQKHISDRGTEQSMSVHSGEAENIYENPEDIRQAPSLGSVYMDLKPRGEDDVYKELERC
ncbi:g6f-like isoform X5 [Pseudoliparis swirei]|uniref:g6f-like isoform X5 n=1 Tax=Pseudoliparis swirei TaxID=2059687 RepID=UPI0024BE1EA7|nr:g6f-like isoform X5 [Pseudoliparis swirei]